MHPLSRLLDSNYLHQKPHPLVQFNQQLSTLQAELLTSTHTMKRGAPFIIIKITCSLLFVASWDLSTESWDIRKEYPPGFLRAGYWRDRHFEQNKWGILTRDKFVGSDIDIFFEGKKITNYRWDFYVKDNEVRLFAHRGNTGRYDFVVYSKERDYAELYPIDVFFGNQRHVPYAFHVSAQTTSARVFFRKEESYEDISDKTKCAICNDLSAINYYNESDVVKPLSNSFNISRFDARQTTYMVTFEGLKADTYYKVVGLRSLWWEDKPKEEPFLIFKTYRKPISKPPDIISIIPFPSELLVQFTLDTSVKTRFTGGPPIKTEEESVQGYIAKVFNGAGKFLKEIDVPVKALHVNHSSELTGVIYIDNLEPKTTYNVELQAYDESLRRSPASSRLSGTTTAKSEVADALIEEFTIRSVTDEKIEVSWKGKTSKYLLSFKQTTPKPEIELLKKQSVMKTEYIFTGLQSSATYEITLAATDGSFLPFKMVISTVEKLELQSKSMQEKRAEIKRVGVELQGLEEKIRENEKMIETFEQELRGGEATINETSIEMAKMATELKSRKARIIRMFRSPYSIRKTVIIMEVFMALVLLLAKRRMVIAHTDKKLENIGDTHINTYASFKKNPSRA
ncbi:hypothetical protein GCK32_005215 [Trichostrongylus colubriformis]|uniref:Fibronectin type-III domain-containing protein n=1 Tax=Trichostrongylus colubriformis TaxID=6319 RepID=A0AAN8IDM6_TRICO